VGRISGVAPRAQLAASKVCWDGRDRDGAHAEAVGRESDAVGAGEAAITDGVNVLNISLGAGPSAVFGPLEGALLQAAGAGIFIAGSAGNNGPEAGTVGAPGAVPWATSVAATTLARAFQASAAATGGGGGLEVQGASATPGLGRARLVDAATAAAPGVEGVRAQQCQAGSLDPAKVAGTAVLCRRGGNARLDKGRAVHDAGGAGMILANDSDAETLAADVQPLPALNVSPADGLALQRLLSAGPTDISMTAGRAVASAGDMLAGFSSRGPQAAVPDIAKPDLAAPGVAILAASTPTPSRPDQPREAFRVFNGTSMSSAVVAGAAALLHQLDPGRSPAALKSSLMTTARPEVHGAGGGTAGPFESGSGRVDPNRAADPGLVLDIAAVDYARYLKAVDPKSVAGDAQPLAPSDLNLPAVSYSALIGAALTRRTFTGADRAAGTWRVRIEGLAGVAAGALPDSFTIEPGHTQDVRLAFAWAGAPLGRYVFGVVRLTNAADGRTVRLPVSIRPAPLESAAPGVPKGGAF
jgi:hypothetical protein